MIKDTHRLETAISFFSVYFARVRAKVALPSESKPSNELGGLQHLLLFPLAAPFWLRAITSAADRRLDSNCSELV